MAMRNLLNHAAFLFLSLSLVSQIAAKEWPVGGSTRFYDFKVQTTKVTKLCKTTNIITINGMYPGPVVYAQEDDRVIVKVTNLTPHNATIHWHGVRQKLSCWFDGPSYLTQCPIQAGQSFTYEFTLVGQKGTLFWHAHFSWLRATVYGALVIYPKNDVPYPFPSPYEEHILIIGEWWNKDVLQIERDVLASGGNPPVADAYVINGQPGPLYNCSKNDIYILEVVPKETYLLRIINAALNTGHFFAIADHKLTVAELDGEYTKSYTVDHIMLGPGQSANVLVTTDQPVAKYAMAASPYISAQNVSFQNISAIAHFHYRNANPNGVALPAQVPNFNENSAANNFVTGLRSLNAVRVPLEIDTNLFFTVGLNVDECHSSTPNKSCQGINGGVNKASMNNISFVRPSVSLLEAYYKHINGYYTDDFPGVPLKNYDFVNGAPNNIPNDTQALNGTRVYVLEYGTRVQLILQDTVIVGVENHPIHLHGYSFYVVGSGSGNYNPQSANFNLVDPPYRNTVGVPVGGWAAIRFVADNPGVWFMHCHFEIHLSWGLSMAFIVKNGDGPLESLPHPPADLPKC
ncbi:hypothetical protein AMTRI_Chr09g43010 [Amborella trichopoda]|uniref:Laccase n=1 Tax=Amborella trichopoda TaxID=13333 RepID=U5D121_AMBTC|nr:laccase-6 [Amborella trichopoda]ERN19331.1 hypothetical protein AMTR_s00069p00085210 [Amborella trichopoda]|eukprot:XP_006857864.1 laccase-6 [Amborella trichopoda]